MPTHWSKKNPIAHDRVLELLRYDPGTGHFYWRVDRRGYGGKAKAGNRAGTIDRYGYRVITLDGHSVQAQVLAWFYVNETWPECQVDHKNRGTDDNWIDNLREATMTEQRANQRVRKDSKTGLKGVGRARSGRFLAKIKKNGVSYSLGTFDTSGEASAAYAFKAVELFGEFARAA